MADFCFQCNIDSYYVPYSDFSYLSEMYDDDETYFGVLCEGCGPTVVNRHGWCVAEDCLEHHHHAPPERRKAYERAARWVERRAGRTGWALRLWDWWAGTPWEPGQWQYLKWRWNDWLHGDRGAVLFSEGFEDHGPAFDELTPAIGTQVAGEDDQEPDPAKVPRDQDIGPV